MAKRICIYCGKEFEEKDMTREHVIPQVIGGNIEEQNPFIAYNVCKRCNNTAGTFIDGIFAKQFLVDAYINLIKKRYTDINVNPFIPPAYMGMTSEFKFNDKICEMWVEHDGSSIFHFHKPYEEKSYINIVGKPTYIKSSEIDPGFVFIYIVSNNPVWQKTVINSVRKTFKDTIIYLGNGSHKICEYFSEIPQELDELHNLITQKMNSRESFEIHLASDLHINDRFTCKMALGLSAIFLKDEFALTDEAKQLRNGMWAKKSEEFNNIKIHGSGLNYSLTEADEMLKMDNCHVIMLIQTIEGISLKLSLWGKIASTIFLTKNKQLLKQDIPDGNGLVYVIVPGLKKCVGPINFIDYISFILGYKSNEKLTNLKKQIEEIPELPPRKI
ncbi:HNH endonuclease [Clostridium butyricum]|uniref:HNH endonuclease n=1 Tax=Clostridium butyricum TaxID=1492 RepID=UPI00374F2792